MKTTYRAMQVVQPGVLELVERQTPTPGPGQVLIAVEACGVCGADLADIDKADPGRAYPATRSLGALSRSEQVFRPSGS